MANHLFSGDNLGVLRDHLTAESVDLISLDPPFNNHATCNVLFKSPAAASHANSLRRHHRCPPRGNFP